MLRKSFQHPDQVEEMLTIDWNAKEFGLLEIDDFLNRSNCTSKEERFFACIESLNYLLGYYKNGHFLFYSKKDTFKYSKENVINFSLANGLHLLDRSKEGKKALLAKFKGNGDKVEEAYRNGFKEFL